MRSKAIDLTAATTVNSQLDKFKAAARQLETDDDPERFKERVGKLVRHRPAEKAE